MAQFLIVHRLTADGAAAEAAAELFARGVERFGGLCGLAPEVTREFGPARIAVFGTGTGPADWMETGPDGRWLCQAGAVFYQGRTDARALTELARHLDGAEREATLKETSGVFALASGNAEGGWSVVTDRLGSLHVYHARHAGCVLVSTSSLVLAALLQPTWDLASCREYLSYGNVFEDRTLFSGIAKIGPARMWSPGNGPLIYWRVADCAWAPGRQEATLAQMAGALVEACAAIGAGLPDPVFDLTGGFDSRIVLGASLKAGLRPAVTVAGPPGDADVEVARNLSRMYGLPLTVIHPQWKDAAEWREAALAALAYTDGEYDVLEYARILAVHRRLRMAGHGASVNGSNGEILKGYWWELLFPRTGRAEALNSRQIAAARFASSAGASGLLAARFETDLAGHFAEVIQRAGREMAGLPNTAQLDNVYLTLRMQRWQGRIASSTARVWPSTSPFFFRAPLEAALSTPPRQRVRHRLSRRLIEYLDPRLAAQPLAQGYPALPVRLSTLPHFAPLAREIAGKFYRHGMRRLGLAAAAPAASNPVAALARDPETAALLDTAEMRTAALYDLARLRRFLEAARDPSFDGAAAWARVFTLEALARAVAAR